MILVACDTATVALFLMFIVYLKMRIETVTSEIEGTNITAADYSVLVRGLPPDATKEDVLDHFEQLYNLAEKDWTFRGFCWFFGRKMRRRPRQLTEASKAAKVRHAEVVKWGRGLVAMPRTRGVTCTVSVREFQL